MRPKHFPQLLWVFYIQLTWTGNEYIFNTEHKIRRVKRIFSAFFTDLSTPQLKWCLSCFKLHSSSSPVSVNIALCIPYDTLLFSFCSSEWKIVFCVCFATNASLYRFASASIFRCFYRYCIVLVVVIYLCSVHSDMHFDEHGNAMIYACHFYYPAVYYSLPQWQN